MEIIYFYLLMIVVLLSVLIISIERLNKNIIELHNNLDSKLSIIQDTIIDIHPNYKYKKVYESERYKKKL